MIQAHVQNKVTCRFNIAKKIATTEFAVESPQQAGFSPVAKKLFGFPWVEKLRIGKDYVELTKKEWVEWDVIVEPLMGLLEEHFTATTKLEEPLPETAAAPSSEADTIRQYIENQINPALASHGGFVELKSYDKNTAFLSMGGGCQGCASSQATMVDGIENALKNEFKFVHKVVDVTDHAMGENPFFSN